MSKQQIFANVWEAIEDTPEAVAAMTAPSDAMIAITDRVRAWNVSQKAAQRLGVTRPRLRGLLKGHIEKFSLDALMTLAQRAGIKRKRH